MKNCKFTLRKKMLLVITAAVAVSLVVSSNFSANEGYDSTVSKLDETKKLNENAEKLNTEIISDDETKDISSSGSQNGNESSTPKDNTPQNSTKQKATPKAATDAPKADTTKPIHKDNMSVKSEKMLDFSKWNKTCTPTLVVVNKDNPIPENYPISLENYNGKKINVSLKDDLDAMINAAAKDGIKIFICSGYRNIEKQTGLFNAEVYKWKNQGYNPQDAQIKAASVVARPRTSEHNTGLAIDFNCVRDDFYKTKEYAWLIKNSAEYGFILRYAKDKTNKTGVIYEPWHFRYVGKEHAPKIMASGLCLEEYIAQLQK